jgi:hypothetical protein
MRPAARLPILLLPILAAVVSAGALGSGANGSAEAAAEPASAAVLGTTAAGALESAAERAAAGAPPSGAPASAVDSDVGDPAGSAGAHAAAALSALAGAVTVASHPEALERAFLAYFNYRAAHPERIRKPYLYYVDLGLDNRTRRGWVFDMDALTVVDGPFTVAHGRGSASQRDGVPTSFSNRPGSNASSLGLYLAQETYTFRGRSGGRSYSSVGLRMKGESGSFNSAARQRGIVAHGAPYVTATAAGRSEGCPAMEQHRADRLLPLIANGGVVFIFSPADRRWLNSDPWMTGV